MCHPEGCYMSGPGWTVHLNVATNCHLQLCSRVCFVAYLLRAAGLLQGHAQQPHQVCQGACIPCSQPCVQELCSKRCSCATQCSWRTWRQGCPASRNHDVMEHNREYTSWSEPLLLLTIADLAGTGGLCQSIKNIDQGDAPQGSDDLSLILVHQGVAFQQWILRCSKAQQCFLQPGVGLAGDAKESSSTFMQHSTYLEDAEASRLQSLYLACSHLEASVDILLQAHD